VVKTAAKVGRRQKTVRARRLNLRTTADQAELIRTGAESRGLSVTDFVLESACQQAEQVLADQREFVLSPKQWQAFVKALDRPARVTPGLARLFTEPNALTRRTAK
jgi:uncharacterized protein (DUF1778 family)